MESVKVAPNWQPLIELAFVAVMVIGTVVPLYIHTDGKLHDAITAMQDDMKKFQEEMKVIHGRVSVVEERSKR